jgi:hypothetical protein
MTMRSRLPPRPRPLLALSVALAALLAATSAASASHAPGHAERVALRNATLHSRFVSAPIAAGHFRLLGGRVSTAGPWAKARITPTGPARDRLDAVLAIFKHSGHAWRLTMLGTAQVDCDGPRLPKPVRRDLHIVCD